MDNASNISMRTEILDEIDPEWLTWTEIASEHPKQDEPGGTFSSSISIDSLTNQLSLPQENSMMNAMFQDNAVNEFVQDREKLGKNGEFINTSISDDLIIEHFPLLDDDRIIMDVNCMEDGHCSSIVDNIHSSLFTDEMPHYEKDFASDLTTCNIRNLQTNNMKENQDFILDTKNYSCQTYVNQCCNSLSSETIINDFDELLHLNGSDFENLDFSLSTSNNSLTNQFSLCQENSIKNANFIDNSVENCHTALEANLSHMDSSKEAMGQNREIDLNITKDLINDNFPLLDVDEDNIIMDANYVEDGLCTLSIDDLHSSLFTNESQKQFGKNLASDSNRSTYNMVENFETSNMAKESHCSGFILDNNFCLSDVNSLHQPGMSICSEQIIKEFDKGFPLMRRESKISDKCFTDLSYNSPDLFFDVESYALVDKEDQHCESNTHLTLCSPKFPRNEVEITGSLEAAHNLWDKSPSFSSVKGNQVEFRLEDYLQDHLEENRFCGYLASPSWESEICFPHYIATDSCHTYRNSLDLNKISNDVNFTGVPGVDISNSPISTISIANNTVPSCSFLKTGEPQMQVDTNSQTNPKVVRYTGDDETGMGSEKHMLKMIIPSSNKRISVLNTDFLNKKSSTEREPTQSLCREEHLNRFSKKPAEKQLSCPKKKSPFKITTLRKRHRKRAPLQQPTPQVETVSCSLTNETMPVFSTFNNTDNTAHAEATAVNENNSIGETIIRETGTDDATHTHTDYFEENGNVFFPKPNDNNNESDSPSRIPSKMAVNVIGTYGKPEECSCYCVNVGMKDQYVCLRVRDMLKMSVKNLLSIAGHGQNQVKSEQEIATEKRAERNYLFERKRRRLFDDTMRQRNFMAHHQQ